MAVGDGPFHQEVPRLAGGPKDDDVHDSAPLAHGRTRERSCWRLGSQEP
jgi:hypothetical protein